jgi:hypothetical protein
MQVIKVEKIHNIRVTVPKLVITPDPANFKGRDLFPGVYSNIFICARKNSGKTLTIRTILQHSIDRNTKVIIFCSSIDKDSAWLSITKELAKANIDVTVHKQLLHGKKDILAGIMATLGAGDEEEEYSGSEEEVETGLIQGDPPSRLEQKPNNPDNKEPVRRRSKWVTPDYVIIMDDISSKELKRPSIASLLKRNRHFHIMTIISSQYVHDLSKESLLQVDLWLLFKSLPEDKIEKVYKDSNVVVNFPLFYQMYLRATERPFSFFFVDTRNNVFGQNFNIKYRINAHPPKQN